MTFLEKRLLELFNTCNDYCKEAILEVAEIYSSRCSNPVSSSKITQMPNVSDSPNQNNAEKVYKFSMEKAVINADIPSSYQINTNQIYHLYEMICDRKPIEAIVMAYNYGFVKGNRATRRGKVKAL